MTAKYDVQRYQKSYQQVRDARKGVDDLPEEIRDRVKLLLKHAVDGTVKSCKEIYCPRQPITHPGSDADYETDKRELYNLEALFL